MSIKMANKLASKINEYHSKGTAPHEGAAPGPSGPMHKDLSHPASAAESIENSSLDHDELKEILCPGCMDKARGRMVKNEKDEMMVVKRNFGICANVILAIFESFS